MAKKDKSDARTGLDYEWKRLKNLIPVVNEDQRVVDDIEKDILSVVDGKSTCENIIKEQKTFSKDGAIIILLKLEKDGIINCIDPVEKLRDIKFEKHEAEKELEFTSLEKKRLSKMISERKEEIYSVKSARTRIKNETAALREKIERINKNLVRVNKKHKESTRSVDQLVATKMDLLRRNKDVVKTLTIIKEEIAFLNDEKWSAMHSIKDLEGKIEEAIQVTEDVSPKMSVYRSMVRDAYKTLRSAQARADFAMKKV